MFLHGFGEGEGSLSNHAQRTQNIKNKKANSKLKIALDLLNIKKEGCTPLRLYY
jgi:hypothetical protein